ncbi:unnamed protein product [Rotaria sordida]|uniref:RNA helicase n=1 Tax=Rotaria sordida TaxID=392033 RepID=A0A814GY06_9BILA|nr:unnamed protein product [Rotaria sordida]
MTLNNSSSKWSVRIDHLPTSINYIRLAQELRLPKSRIYIPKIFKNNTPYAWINDFADEEEANEFVRQWSGAFILGQHIICVVSSPRSNQFNSPRLSQKLLASGIEPLPNQQHSSGLSTQPKIRRENSNVLITSAPSFHHSNKDQDTFQNLQKPNRPSTRNLLKNQDTQDKRPLCPNENKGACRQKINECEYRHQRCVNYESCTNSKCELAHVREDNMTDDKGNLNTYDPSRSRSDSSSSMSSLLSMSSIQSTYTRSKLCLNGIKCFNVNCIFNHPNGWNPCIDGEKCENYECTANHSYKRKAKCHDHNHCKVSNCKFLHPKTRVKECYLRAKCKRWDCPGLHPRIRARLCPNKKNCTNLTCLCLHPPERDRLLCLLGVDCRDLSCRSNHPPERPPVCDKPDVCPNFNCTHLHQPEWDPCEAGDECEDKQCSKIHSFERDITIQQKEAASPTNISIKNKNQKTKKKYLKTLEQRIKDREKTQLPILSCQETFCQRLEHERILIVTAETGSGKSTQLPQYAAEYFGSLVVCTQPRVVAALSLARRVAEEYDGKSVGESVGYQAGNANRVQGTDIMFMTDAALIRESQRDPILKHVRVLIIDEAHDRSLNTDIVIGISKLLLAQRPDDFYVVIASATIDPTHFLQFFDRPTSALLEVKGRIFSVSKDEKPPPLNCSDQKLIVSHIVPSIVELYPHHQGHTLVFLPGQGEIEQALKIFKSMLPDDCVALPLYGSQSPEDQEKVIKFNETDKRMVVFCTNVAETSLTIPNVRLVIDSGLVKEAHYDVKRRLTVIETVRISRSSADQRKGRAGRTASGHCVRLYEDNELIRSNIEPEILRSSLDLVLLQLIRLNFDPKTFPFMDQPHSDSISHSFDLLTKLKCIDEQKITKRGELFTELALDPRLSAFIVDIYTEYKSLLDLAVAIVAILSAPGIVFFMGGATQEAKQEAKARVALEAHNHESDLIHLYSVYDRWKNAGGQEIQGKCSKCNRLVKYCTCRVKHSNENSLNNKILQHIDGLCTSIIKQIRNTRWLQPGHKMSEDVIKIIGSHLAKLFSEQCGYLLVPQLPVEGVRLVSTDIRGNITNTSVFMQKLHMNSDRELYQHFVAMTITQLPSGRYIIERLHPILRSDVTVQSSIQNLITIENIGFEYGYHLHQKLNTYRSESWAKWLVYHYDRSQCRFILWGLETDRSTVLSIVQHSQDETLKKLFDAYELLECGPIKANFQSGLVCTHINKMSDALKLHLQNVPCYTMNELKDWVKKTIGIAWSEIKAHGFYNVKVASETNNNDNQKKYVYLVFKNEDIFRRASITIPSYYMVVQGNNFGRYYDSEKESLGRELVIQTSPNVTVEDIINRYGADVVIKCIQLNEKSRLESFIKLNNLPITTDEACLRKYLQDYNGPTPKYMYVGRTKNNASGWAKITFYNDEQRNQAATIYESKLCQTIFGITIMGKRGLKQKYVRTSVMKNDDPNIRHNQSSSFLRNIFLITTISREAALQIFSSQTRKTSMNQTSTTSVFNACDTSQWTVDSSATVTILRTDLYPNFQQTIDGICNRFRVQVKCKHIPNFGKRCTFSHGSPQKTSLAASMLSQTFAPINIILNTERQKQLFRELEEIGEIQKWAEELCLAINPNKYFTNIEIRGPQTSQGQLMRRIADYSDDFDRRFRELELSATVATFFGQQKSASGKLQQIDSRWSSKSCSVSFNSKTATITIISKPDVSLTDMNTCENEVLQLLNETIASTDDTESDDEEKEEEDDNNDVRIDSDVIRFGTRRLERRCVFCHQKSSISASFFRICGHTYCRCAAQALATSHTFPFRCKTCQSNIHIRDIQIIFSNNEQLLLPLLKSSIQHYLTTNPQQDDRIFCPNDECNGLIRLNNGYQTCLTCGQNVCPRCQVIDDELHAEMTCDQVVEEKKRHPFLSTLFVAAKKFVEDNWPFDPIVQPTGPIYENPYLRKEYESLSRFYEGNKRLGHSFPPDLAKGFFAYHGTSLEAIDSICKTGFDPKRRSAQAYGRGEYFGVTALISHGYCQKGGSHAGFSQMIIAFILRCTQVTTKENFCYVVDNPTDWTYAFNLPVLIVTYGQNAAKQPSPFPAEIPYYVDKESIWIAPFRWYCQQDNGRFEPYNDIMNELLEKIYEHWKLHDGPAEIETPLLTRYLDDISETYKIDFQKNRQTNTKTFYQQAINRRLVSNLTNNRNWFYSNEHATWMRYEQTVENKIEQAFQFYCSSRGPSTIDIQFHGHRNLDDDPITNIYNYGSWVYDTNHEKLDRDFLVIMKNKDENK